MKGPQGQKQPGDVVGCAVTVAKVATSGSETLDQALKVSPKPAHGTAKRS